MPSNTSACPSAIAKSSFCSNCPSLALFSAMESTLQSGGGSVEQAAFPKYELLWVSYYFSLGLRFLIFKLGMYE